MKLTLINDNRFQIDFDYSLQGKTKSFKEEVQDHLLEIAKAYKKVYLLFSGGLDSRFLALNLLELGIDFTAITYGFKEDFTDVDSLFSKEFAQKHNFKHEIFYITSEEIINMTYFCHNEKQVFIPVFNQYCILCAIKKYHEPNCAFITGACSEFKINNKKIDFPFNIYITKQVYESLFNFTTDKILFAYLNESIIKKNYHYTKDPFDLRNKLYNNIYPNIGMDKKIEADNNVLVQFFHEIGIKLFRDHPFVFLTQPYILDLDEYYQEYEERKKNGS
jgi:hypothetical protein